MANKKYTAAQKRAYYSGQGYRLARANKAIPFKNEKNKESFRQGYKSVDKQAKSYPNLNKK